MLGARSAKRATEGGGRPLRRAEQPAHGRDRWER
jgi:hypothetical protein